MYLFAVDAIDEGAEESLYEPLVDTAEVAPVSKLMKLKNDVTTILK